MTENESSILIDKIKAFKKNIKIIRIILICVIVLFIASLFLDVSRFNYKYDPINYKPFTENCRIDGYYYIDELEFYTEAFEIKTTLTNENGVHVGIGSSKKYYLAVDNNGFSFLIQVDGDIKDYWTIDPNSNEQDLKLYGQAATVPTNIELNPYDLINSEIWDKYLSSDADSMDLHQFSNDRKSELMSFIKQHKVISLFSKPPQELKTKDGKNPLYVVLMTARILMFVAFFVICFFEKRYTIQFKYKLTTEIERIRSLENPSAEAEETKETTATKEPKPNVWDKYKEKDI